MKAPNKTYRIFADVEYLQPSVDHFGFPDDPSILNHDPQIVVLSEEMGELIAEVIATDEQDLRSRILRMAKLNRNLATITLRAGDQGVVEL